MMEILQEYPSQPVCLTWRLRGQPRRTGRQCRWETWCMPSWWWPAGTWSPELVCVDSYGKKAGLWVLAGGGFMFSVPLHLIRKLLAPDSSLLATLGGSTPFEVAVGMNGRVWVRARSVRETMILAQAMECSEHMTKEEARAMCDKMGDVLAGF